MPLTGFVIRENSQAIIQQTNQRWETDDTGKQVYMQDTVEKLSSDKRCLAIRTRRRYGSYGGNQCSSKASIKWSDGNLCAKCSHETHEIIALQRSSFVHQHIQHNLLWDEPQEQWEAYLKGEYKLPENIRRATQGYRNDEFHIHYHKFGMEKIYTDAGRIPPMAVDDQLEQRRRNMVMAQENHFCHNTPTSDVGLSQKRLDIQVYLGLKGGLHWKKAMPTPLMHHSKFIESILGNKIVWGDASMTDENKAIHQKNFDNWWWNMSNMRWTDDELTGLCLWYQEIEALQDDYRESLQKLQEGFTNDVDLTAHKELTFPWLEEQPSSIMDLSEEE
tara:strand:- start:314 stop:1309 length:996 start_codon:yes stop_codon:yes gene_type:complete